MKGCSTRLIGDLNCWQALERRQTEERRIDALARFLVAVDRAENALDPEPIFQLADAILTEEPGRPLRFLHADVGPTQAYLGGPEYPPGARFIAVHSLNCACVLARLAHDDPDLQGPARELVVAGLMHDVGMLRIDPEIIGSAGPFDDEQRRVVAAHALTGANRLAACLPTLGYLAESAACHHERADRGGYPAGLAANQLSPLTRLVAVVDVYAALCSRRPHRPAFDPRTALTDVGLMAERGLFDQQAAGKLASIGLYPIGTVVELADGATAVVLSPRDPRTTYKAGSRPGVAILADSTGRAFPNPRFVDLAETRGGNIVRALDAGNRLERLGRSYPEWV